MSGIGKKQLKTKQGKQTILRDKRKKVEKEKENKLSKITDKMRNGHIIQHVADFPIYDTPVDMPKIKPAKEETSGGQDNEKHSK